MITPDDKEICYLPFKESATFPEIYIDEGEIKEIDYDNTTELKNANLDSLVEQVQDHIPELSESELAKLIQFIDKEL